MAWNDFMVPILRLMINDTDSSNYKYTDDRLEQQILLAGRYVNDELGFEYEINVATITIDPDPTDSPMDNPFINLTSLKAACMLSQAETMLGIGQGFDISDGGSRIALGNRASNMIEFLKNGGYCSAYEQAKQEYLLGNLNAGMAVVSPFRVFIGWDNSTTEEDFFS